MKSISVQVQLIGLIVFVAFILLSCETKKETNGSYFGNGFHSGCADHTSVVLWIRLTKNPERNSLGEKFLVPSVEEHRQLGREADLEKIWKAQIPKSFTLEQMDGACPCASVEVKLTYYPLAQVINKVITEWVAVDNEKNFTLNL